MQLMNPMDCIPLAEVVVKDMEDIQCFLLSNPADRMEMTNVQLCTHGLIKISKTVGLYTKAVEWWNQKDLHTRQQWSVFEAHFIDKYE